jgi:predicted metal-dependent hydrolase
MPGMKTGTAAHRFSRIGGVRGQGLKDGAKMVNGGARPDQDRGVDYRIRRSARAKNVRLQLSVKDGLTVVVPLNFNLRRIPAIVEEKRAWIETNRRQLAERAEAGARVPLAALPERIELPAVGESWEVDYQPAKTRTVGVIADRPGRIVVYGAVHDRDACRRVLMLWLRQRAREELVPLLVRLAEENGFTFGEVFIRGQKTRWASCSSGGTISLSFKLLFLDRDAVRCVLMHELCHTVLMNHSPRFWALLGGFEPAYKVINKRMREGWKQVPTWVELRAGHDRSEDIC